jgi:5,10-methylenetetrahydromethanopterin reductase
MKFSIGYLPDFPIPDALRVIRKADELGFHAFWTADEIYHRDPWQLCAIGSKETKRIRFGPCLTHLYLNDPTIVARNLCTLDEISNGRAACTVGIGNIIQLDQYHVNWRGTRPTERLREGISVMKNLLETGAITHEGRNFKYTGLSTTARAKGKVPIYLGAMGSPKSFQLAGEVTDGLMSGLGYSQEFWRDVLENLKIGAEKAGRRIDELQVGDWINICVSRDSDAAKLAAKSVVGFSIPSMPGRQLRLHGINPADVNDLKRAVIGGDGSKVVELTSMDYVEKLSVSGTPDEIVEKLEKNFKRQGVNQIIASIIDPPACKALSGMSLRGIPDAIDQMEVIQKEIAPHLT